MSFTAPERETVIRLNADDELATVYAAHRSAEARADGHGPPTPAVGTAGPTVLEAAVDYHRRGYARAPRRAVKRTPSEATAFCIRLSSDPRFHMLSPTYRYCLLYAALHYADGEGKFWHGVPRWSSGVGTSESTIRLAVKGAEKLGLLTREPYARPNGSQGSNTYRFDPSVVSGVAAAAQACRREGEDEPTRVVTAEDPEQNCFKGGAYRPHQRYEKEEKQEAASFEELAALKKDCSHNVTQNQARARVAAQERESSARGSDTSLEGWLQDEALGGHE